MHDGSALNYSTIRASHVSGTVERLLNRANAAIGIIMRFDKQ